MMKLDGIHHITAITADAQENVDFYAGVLGLRLVKKTVNQDNPTVYHLFYADEKGDPGSDLTFFEYPGIPKGRAGDGMVHRIVWRVASAAALDFWVERLAGAGVDAERVDGREAIRFRDPEGLEHELLVSDSPDAAAHRRASGGPGRARPPGVRRRLRLRVRAGGERGASRRRPRLRAPRRRALGVRAATCAARIYAYHDATRRARAPGRGQRPPRRLGVDAVRARGVARAGHRTRAPGRLR